MFTWIHFMVQMTVWTCVEVGRFIDYKYLALFYCWQMCSPSHCDFVWPAEVGYPTQDWKVTGLYPCHAHSTTMYCYVFELLVAQLKQLPAAPIGCISRLLGQLHRTGFVIVLDDSDEKTFLHSVLFPKPFFFVNVLQRIRFQNINNTVLLVSEH